MMMYARLCVYVGAQTAKKAIGDCQKLFYLSDHLLSVKHKMNAFLNNIFLFNH
jgi:hypothetical protein